MYLLYVDESGNPDGSEDSYFVLGGIAMFERKVYWLNDDLDKLEKQFFPSGAQVEFHAQAILSHRDEPWHSLPSKKRNEVFDGLCTAVSGHEVVLFAVNNK